MSHHGYWDQRPRTYSASRIPTWNPMVTNCLVSVYQNYESSSQIIFVQLGVWETSNDNWKHIYSKMYISINYVDINIYPLTMEWNAPLSMFIWKEHNIKWQYYYHYYYHYYYYYYYYYYWQWTAYMAQEGDVIVCDITNLNYRYRKLSRVYPKTLLDQRFVIFVL